MLYAEVIIDIAHASVDRPFHYRVPDALKDTLKPGDLVRVPFGSGNRQKRMKFPHLLFQKLHIPVRRKPGYLNITVFSYHIQGLCPD